MFSTHRRDNEWTATSGVTLFREGECRKPVGQSRSKN